MSKCKYVRISYSRDSLIYLAGIVDGEGCLIISKHHAQTKTHACNYAAKLEISNTDKRLMDWLEENFGGRVDILGGIQRKTANRKIAYRWTCESLKLTHLCELIYPFSVFKKDQIELILKFRKRCEQPTSYKGKQGIQPMTQEEFDFRHGLFLEMKKLHACNRRK